MNFSAEYLTPAAAARMIGYAVGSLANMRTAGTGPKWVKPKGRVRYPKADLIAWMERR